MLPGLMKRPAQNYLPQAGLGLQTGVFNVFGATVKRTSARRRGRGMVILFSAHDPSVAILSLNTMSTEMNGCSG